MFNVFVNYLLSIAVLFVKLLMFPSNRLTIERCIVIQIQLRFIIYCCFIILTLDMDPLQLVFLGFTTTKIDSLYESKGSVTSNNMKNEKYCVTKIKDQNQRTCVPCSVNVILGEKINHISAQMMEI